jgi:hypothetical protein
MSEPQAGYKGEPTVHISNGGAGIPAPPTATLSPPGGDGPKGIEQRLEDLEQQLGKVRGDLSLLHRLYWSLNEYDLWRVGKVKDLIEEMRRSLVSTPQ